MIVNVILLMGSFWILAQRLIKLIMTFCSKNCILLTLEGHFWNGSKIFFPSVDNGLSSRVLCLIGVWWHLVCLRVLFLVLYCFCSLLMTLMMLFLPPFFNLLMITQLSSLFTVSLITESSSRTFKISSSGQFAISFLLIFPNALLCIWPDLFLLPFVYIFLAFMITFLKNCVVLL